MTISYASPITIEDVRAAEARIRPHLEPSPARRYAELDALAGLSVLVKHENHLPTGAFKVRNGLSLMTALDDEARRRGVVAATTGNHGLGLAHAGALLGVDVTICVPRGNNPEKNAAIRALGARLVEDGDDYDAAVQAAFALRDGEGRTLAHSTNDARILAGAATMTLELLAQAPDLDALVVAVGGGSQAVGAITVARALRPALEVYGVQAAGASAQHDSWHARERRTTDRAVTFAEGVATRTTYDLTWDTLRDGLAGFVTVTDAEVAEGVRTILRVTHNVVEGAAAMGWAALPKLRDRLNGKRVGIVFCGANLDSAVLRRILNGEM